MNKRYPYCWSEYSVPVNSTGRGSQHYAPQFEGVYNDTWCNDPDNVVRPVFLLEAHTAPLDLYWYSGTKFTPFNEKMNANNTRFMFGNWSSDSTFF